MIECNFEAKAQISFISLEVSQAPRHNSQFQENLLLY